MPKILFIDGPWRGHVRDEVTARALQFVDYSKVTPAVADGSDVVFPVGTYWVHRYVIAGRVLLLGSTSYETPDKLADDVFWDLLASDAAKEVAQPGPVPPERNRLDPDTEYLRAVGKYPPPVRTLSVEEIVNPQPRGGGQPVTDVWIVVIRDRHDTDAEVAPFSSEERAVAVAREYAGDVSLPDGVTADEVMYVPGEQELSDAMREDGWVLWLVYSIEGDSVRVVKRTMDGDLP